MTLKRDNLVFLPKISKPQKTFSSGSRRKSLETYALYGICKQPIFSHETT